MQRTFRFVPPALRRLQRMQGAGNERLRSLLWLGQGQGEAWCYAGSTTIGATRRVLARVSPRSDVCWPAVSSRPDCAGPRSAPAQTVLARGQLLLRLTGNTNDSRDPFRHVDLQSRLSRIPQ
jgi:hypothetical protein